jgi:hypothetical protein
LEDWQIGRLVDYGPIPVAPCVVCARSRELSEEKR